MCFQISAFEEHFSPRLPLAVKHWNHLFNWMIEEEPPTAPHIWLQASYQSSQHGFKAVSSKEKNHHPLVSQSNMRFKCKPQASLPCVLPPCLWLFLTNALRSIMHSPGAAPPFILIHPATEREREWNYCSAQAVIVLKTLWRTLQRGGVMMWRWLLYFHQHIHMRILTWRIRKGWWKRQNRDKLSHFCRKTFYTFAAIKLICTLRLKHLFQISSDVANI